MARKAKAERAEERAWGLREKLAAARLAIINGLNWGGGGDELVGAELEAREELRAALRATSGMLRARVSNGARSEIEVSLNPFAGDAWDGPVHVEAKDRAADEVGAAVGWEVARRPEARGLVRLEWRACDVVGRTADHWERHVATMRAQYAAHAGERGLGSYGKDSIMLLMSGGEDLERAVRGAVWLREARHIEKAVAEAVAADDDARLRGIFQGLYDSCAGRLLAATFRGRSTSEIANWQVLIESDELARVAERAKLVVALLS